MGLAWLGSTRQNRLGLARLEALLQGTVPIFGIDVSCTCPRTLARLGLGLGLGQLSPVDKFDKLKSWCDRTRLDNYCFLFITAFPVPESPKASGGVRSSPPLSLLFGWKAVFRRPTASVVLIFGLFTVYMCTCLCRFYVKLVLEKFQN